MKVIERRKKEYPGNKFINLKRLVKENGVEYFRKMDFIFIKK